MLLKTGLTREDLVASTSSIDGIDKNKIDSNDKIDTFVKENNSTTFRQIIEQVKDNTELNKASNEEKILKEERDAREFDEVINKLQKMQNMIKIANGENESKTTLEDVKKAENEAPLTNKNDEEPENLSENSNYVITEENIDLKIQKIDELKKEIESEVPKSEKINNDEEFLKMYENMFGTITKKKETIEETNDEVNEFKPITKLENISVFENESKYSLKPAYKYIGIAFNTYIIIEMNSELYIIDQHAAHERIMYEQIKKNYYNDEKKDSQLMLLPDVITLTHKEMGIYKDNREMFKKAGFMVEEFGENTIKLTGVPNVLIELETKELFLEALDEINTVARTAKQEIEEKFIATVACKAAVKAHMVLAKDEVEKLLDKLLVLPNPFTCPHGRPTAIKMTKNDIEKKFSRR